ncbi:MAG: hypothetical protein JNL02_06850, partial [Saprospiraceae bacterium]|nr:hypothetical protein [Saprospiraceae bacterium]
MVQYVKCLVLLLLFSETVGAQTPSPPCTTPSAEETLHGNRLRVRLTADGNAKQVTGSTSFVADYDGSPFPKLNLWTGGLWLGGLDTAGNLKLAASSEFTYWKHYLPGPLQPDTNMTQVQCAYWNKIWKVSRAEIEKHRADYADNQQIEEPAGAILAWPGKGNPYFVIMNGFPLPNDTTSLAPFYDRGGDGVYDPFDGDFPHPNGLVPDIAVSEMLWMLFNSGGSNLDCEIQSTVWALDCIGNDVLNSTYFQSFKIVNRGNTALDSFILGIWQPGGMSCYSPSSYIGTKADLQTVFVYKINPDSEASCNMMPGFMERPPVGALTMLNTDLYKSIYMSNTSIGIFPYAVSQPNLPAGYYNFLNGRWNDGSLLTYGWSGYNPTNPFAFPVDHYFTDDPNDPIGWTAPNSNSYWAQTASTLASAKIGTLLPGQSRSVDVAFSYHRGEGLSGLQNVSYMFDRVAELRQSYDQQFEDVCAYTTCSHDDCVWPCDTDRDGIV